MLAKFCAAMVTGLLILSIPAYANPYDDCILQHMGTAQNKEAVYAIERACIDKTSVPIPPDDNFAGGLNAKVGNFNTGNAYGPEYGLVVTLKNTTKFYITEVVVIIYNKTTHQIISKYHVNTFNEPFPPGVILAGLGEPALTQIIKPGEIRRFFVHIDEGAASPSNFRRKFTWGVMPTKGIPAN